MIYAKHFIPLESDPDVFTELLHSLGGSDSLRFVDVWSLEDTDQLAITPQPVLAFVLVLPTTEDYEQRKAEQEAGRKIHASNGDDENVIWFKQTIHNACGLYAILHAICNTQYQGSISESLHPCIGFSLCFMDLALGKAKF